MTRLRRALLCGALAVTPALAAAQPSQNAMVAEALFEEGQKLMQAGKTAEACEKFAASQKLDPAIGTELNLAACHEKLGKTATAWLEFSDAFAQSQKQNDKQRAAFAKSHMESLEKQLYRVVIEILKPNRNQSVKLDGQELAREALGTGIPLDPGPHEIVVTQPGRKTWRRAVNGGSGGTDRIEVPELEEVTYGMPHEEKPPEQPKEESPKEQPKEEPKKGGSSGLLYAGIGVGGAGVAAAAVGAIFGFMAMDAASARDKLCKGGTPCRNQQAFDDDYNARVDQTVAIVMLAGGGALAAAGVTMLVMGLGSKKSEPPPPLGLVLTPRVAPGYAGLGVGGAF